jgi:hypothetical protein
MSTDKDKKEFVEICESMERAIPHASRLEISTALAFSLFKAIKRSPEAMAIWLEEQGA